MKRSLKNLFIIIFVLILVIISGIETVPVHAVGGGMEVVTLSLPSGWSTGFLNAIWGSSASDVYAVGYGSNPNLNGGVSQPLIYHKEGNSWSGDTISLPGGVSQAVFSGVWGSSASDVYAVGSGGSNNNYTVPLVYHKTSGPWSVENLPSFPSGVTSGYLYGIWGSSAGDIYAIGSGNNNTVPLVYHKTGSNWSVTSPALPDWSTEGVVVISGYLYSIWGFSASDIYAVGYGNGGTIPLLYHTTDGSNWIESSPSPHPLLPTNWTRGNFKGVWGPDTSDLYIVGTGYNGTDYLPLVYHKTGGNWAADTLGLPSGVTSGYLNGIWGSSASDIYAVGYGLNGSASVPLLYHKTNGIWAEASPSRPIGWISDSLSGVWGSSASDVYTAGFGNSGTADNMPMLYHSSQNGQDVTAPGDVTNLTQAGAREPW